MPQNEFLDNLLSLLQSQAQPRPDLGVDRPTTYLGRVVKPGETSQEALQRFPQAEMETGGTAMQAPDLFKGLGIGLMAKQFKPGPSTLADLIKQMVKKGELLPNRGRLRPAIRLSSTGEIFSGDVGGLHPHDIVANILTKRKIPSGKLEYGYQQPIENAPFIQEYIAGKMSLPGGPSILNKLLESGVSEEALLDALKFGFNK